MRAWAVVLVGCTPAPAPSIANIASAASDDQRLAPMVVDDFAGCTPHRVQISIDARPASTVAITCPPPPPPRVPGRRVVIVTDSTPRTFDGPAVAIAPGPHTIAVRDELTGRNAELSVRFPLEADTIIIIDDDRAIAIRVDRRALLIVL